MGIDCFIRTKLYCYGNDHKVILVEFINPRITEEGYYLSINKLILTKWIR